MSLVTRSLNVSKIVIYQIELWINVFPERQPAFRLEVWMGMPAP